MNEVGRQEPPWFDEGRRAVILEGVPERENLRRQDEGDDERQSNCVAAAHRRMMPERRAGSATRT
ncbi:hypothetical protein D3C83_188580 [compost metagenome]